MVRKERKRTRNKADRLDPKTAEELVFAAPFILSALTLAPAPAPDPYQLFAHAREKWAARRYPHYLAYTVAVQVSENGVAKSNHYHLTFDTTLGKVDVNPISDEEHAAPPQATGATIHLLPKRQGKAIIDKRVGAAPDAVDYLGVPVIAPTYTFGMLPHATILSLSVNGIDSDALVQQIRNEFHDPMPPVKAEQLQNTGTVKSIASVISTARSYDVTYAGMDAVDGVQCYHLLLHPAVARPYLRLRELWIDPATNLTLQLITAGNFSVANVPWRVKFAHAGDATYILSEEALAPVVFNEHRYEHAVVSFNDVTAIDRPARAIGSFFLSKNLMMSEPEF